MKRYISEGMTTLHRGLHMMLTAAMLLSWTSCQDDMVVSAGGMGHEAYAGEMISFAAGTTESAVGTRAEENDGTSVTPGKTYYMPDSYRFVCRMYYKASADANAKFDVTGGTDITVWMKVKGEVGNSLYWRSYYPTLDEGKSELFDTYGNDKEATCLYWQNRKEHAFLAWTDLNKATTNTFSPVLNSGSLKFVPCDTEYVKHTGEKSTQWVVAKYELYTEGLTTNPEFSSWEALRTYIGEGGNYATYIEAKVPKGLSKNDFEGAKYYYAYGWSCKYSEVKAVEEPVDDNHRKRGWIQYQMFYDKLLYTGEKTGGNIEVKRDTKGHPAYLYHKVYHKYLAEISFDANDPEEKSKWEYYMTDDYGNVLYDEMKPRYTFYFKELLEKKEQEVVNVLPANEFDLTHKSGYKRIDDQPDICQALTLQAPLGATQSANRVNLYFKHQFSLVQVNVKSSDASVAIGKENIKKVELLGVSEKAYVFTELDEDGKVEPTTYEPVDISKYDDNHLQSNPFGTSFEMFDMGYGNDEYEYPAGYARSFNAITFGQLQAIRITWKENESDILHVSTYRVENQKLQNLKSGYKYIWNIELRRGTLAIVRTEIVDWIVPIGDLEYKGDGTIVKETD